MKQRRFSLLHPLWPAVALLAGVILALSMTSAQALPTSPDSPADAPGGIRGTLYPPLGIGSPVADGWIDVYDERGQPWMGTVTGPDGRFEIPNLPPGVYFVIGHPPPGSRFAASMPERVEVPSGAWVTQDLYLTEVKISGWVMDCDTELPLPGIPVVVHDDKDPWTVVLWAETNEVGDFKFGGPVLVEGNTYIVEAFPPPESEYIPVGPVPVVVPAGQVVVQLCIAPVTVFGIVEDSVGAPVPGAGVVIANDEFWRETTADEPEPGGGFVFRGIPPGDYWVQAAPPWGPSGAGLLPSKRIQITVEPDAPPLDVGVLVLPQAVKMVSGQVLDAATGAPVPDAIVVAHRLDRPGFADGPVDREGKFMLYLPGGEWHLGVEPLPPPALPPEWVFPGPPAWVPFVEPDDVPEEITGVILEVFPTNASVEGFVLCPGPTGPVSCADFVPYEAIWVELRNDRIRNEVGLGPDYDFVIPIPHGWYELVVHVEPPFRRQFQGPGPIPIFVGPEQHLILKDPIVLLFKDARITGQVRNALGAGVPDVPVVGWQPEGAGWGWTRTDASGNYTMPVIPGEWFLEPQPLPEQSYVFRRRPQLVRVAPGGTVAGVNFRLAIADSRILGAAVDANTNERLWGLDGWAWAERIVAPGTFEFFSDAPMRDSGFELKVRGGETYAVGVGVPPHAPYVSGGVGPIPVPPLTRVPVPVPLQHKDAVIEGALVIAGTSPPQPALGVWAEVFGEDERGHWVVAGVDPDSAGYEMGVVSGTWHLRAWVDLDSGYVAVPSVTVATVQSGQSLPVDFEVWPINAHIRGIVRAPDGTPVEAFVFAEGESPFVGHFETRVWSDENGRFDLVVPEGGYVVGAALPGDELEARGWLNPRPIDVPWVAADSPATGLELRFRGLDGEIHGTISFAPGIVVSATHPAYVWGWADTGEWAETAAMVVPGTNTFSYTLRVVSDTVWHVGAVYEDPDNGVFYESPEETVPVAPTPPPIAQAFQDLELGGPWTLPQPIIVTFDGSYMQTIKILVSPDRYLELIIPAGALVKSGTVTLFIFPTREMRPEPGREIVGPGYEIWAVDENGREITQFNKNVIMTIPYPSDAVLAQHGIQENLLIPVYYSTLVGHWILADGYVLDTESNEITLMISHFTRFGTFSTELGDTFIYLPLLIRDSS